MSVVVGLIVAITGVVVGQRTKPRKEVEPESYAVYSSVLTQHYGSWFKGQDSVLISASTALEPQGHQGAGDNCRERAKDVGVVRALVEHLLSESEIFEISPKLQLPGKYQIVKGRTHIRENQEPGVVFLSRVEFSPDGSKAIVFVGHSCGFLCGDGFVWTLDKNGNQWMLAKNQLNCGWIR